MVRDNYLSEFQKYQKWIAENEEKKREKKEFAAKSRKNVEQARHVLDEPKEEVDLYDIYKRSSQRMKRTNHNLNFNFSGASFLPPVNDEHLKASRAKRFFDEPCFKLKSSERMNRLVRPVLKRNSLDERFKMFRRSENYSKVKDSDFSSIRLFDNLNQRTNELIKSFRNNLF
jgi:hypothetical protein